MGNWQSQVVVGYDASKESIYALEWAARVAQRRGVPLCVVHSTGVVRPGVELARAGILEMYQRRAQEIAEEGAGRARKLVQGQVEVTAAGVQSGIGAALVEYSRRASLVVLGHRGRSMLTDALLGSAAFTVATHAACPVAVIRSSPRPLPSMQYPIVVGFDGSVDGLRALDEAALLAADTGSFLRIVVAWERPEKSLWSSVFSRQSAELPDASKAESDNSVFPSSWQSPGVDADVYREVVADIAARAADTAKTAVERVQAGYPDLKVEQVVTEGLAPLVIVNAAADASMIAVGARGYGDLQSVLLGSVSRRVIQRAECAVYVIR